MVLLVSLSVHPLRILEPEGNHGLPVWQCRMWALTANTTFLSVSIVVVLPTYFSVSDWCQQQVILGQTYPPASFGEGMFDDLGNFILGSLGVEPEDILFKLPLHEGVPPLDNFGSTSGCRFVLRFHGFVNLSRTPQAEDFSSLIDDDVEYLTCIVGLFTAVLGNENIAF